jgi:hypothetical protein
MPKYKIAYHSGQKLGKAMQQAEHLAALAKKFGPIEIYVYPAPEIKELEKLRERFLGDQRRRLSIDCEIVWTV